MANNLFTVTNVTYAFTATLINNSIQVSSTDSTVTVIESLTTVTTTSTVNTTEIVEKGVVSVYRPATVTVDTFSGDGSTTIFTLSSDPVDNESVEIIIGGVGQIYGQAFTVSGRTITFTGAPPSGTNNISIQYFDVNVGFRGPTGPAGAPGGYTGSRGGTGYTGSLGYTGSTGYTGSVGIGYVGSRGVSGPTGPASSISVGWVNSGTAVTSGNLKVQVGYYVTEPSSRNGYTTTGTIGPLWSTVSGTQIFRSDNTDPNTATVTTSASPIVPWRFFNYDTNNAFYNVTVADFNTLDAWRITWFTQGSASQLHFISIERLD